MRGWREFQVVRREPLGGGGETLRHISAAHAVTRAAPTHTVLVLRTYQWQLCIALLRAYATTLLRVYAAMPCCYAYVIESMLQSKTSEVTINSLAPVPVAVQGALRIAPLVW